MQDCIFCKIIKKEIPSYSLYENDQVMVFLDINPSTNGDCLLVPKKHIVTLEDMEEDLAIHILKVMKQISQLLTEKLDCDGLTIVQNNGYGQEIKHFHIHMTPRYLKDGIVHQFNKDLLVTPEDVYHQIVDTN